jgi:hypothetical protein
MDSKEHLSSGKDDALVQKLCEAFKEARDNGKMHLEVDEFHKNYSELDPNTTLEVLKKQVQKGIIGIDNKQIRPTPLGIEVCRLDKSSFQ